MADVKDYRDELKHIQKANRGMLRPSDVVEYARDSRTALHGRFEWEDSKAAAEYRLWQARELIRVVVEVHPASGASTRVYVSLSDDRRNDGGGYRELNEVMRSKTMREALLKQAHADMVRFETKYQQLAELAGVIKAMRSTRSKKGRAA